MSFLSFFKILSQSINLISNVCLASLIILSNVIPEKKDCTAHKKNNTENTNVGIFTTPLCKKSINTGMKKHIPIIPKINASNVRVRKTATISGTILATLTKDTQATRIEKKVVYKDGYYWDKIKLSNGTIGYIATKYLS